MARGLYGGDTSAAPAAARAARAMARVPHQPAPGNTCVKIRRSCAVTGLTRATFTLCLPTSPQTARRPERASLRAIRALVAPSRTDLVANRLGCEKTWLRRTWGTKLPMTGTIFRHGRRRTGQHMRQDASALTRGQP